MFTSLISCAHPPFYSAKEISATIVDGETGRPLEGTVVVAQWIYFRVGLGDSGDVDYRLKILEAVTDKEGRFTIPGWGPRIRYPFHYLRHYAPQLSIFKSGFLYSRLFNNKVKNTYLRISDWDGKVIRLERPKSEKEYWESVGDFQDSIGWYYTTNWEKIKQAVFVIERERKNKPDKYHLSGLPDDARKILFKE